MELAATQKVTELTEAKPGSKYPPNTTQGERGERGEAAYNLYFFFPVLTERENVVVFYYYYLFMKLNILISILYKLSCLKDPLVSSGSLQ